jgi:hypothetical protein
VRVKEKHAHPSSSFALSSYDKTSKETPHLILPPLSPLPPPSPTPLAIPATDPSTDPPTTQAIDHIYSVTLLNEIDPIGEIYHSVATFLGSGGTNVSSFGGTPRIS